MASGREDARRISGSLLDPRVIDPRQELVVHDDLSEPQKADSVKTWAGIETQAEMVFQSFAYERITWKTSDPAREAANSQFNGFFAKDSFSLFAAALKSANQKYDAAAKVCRE